MRLFIALPIPEEIREKLGEIHHPSVRGGRVPPENYHITLLFLGEVNPGELEELVSAFERIRGNVCSLEVSGLDFFASRRKAVLYAGIGLSEELCALKASVERSCGGFVRDPVSHAFCPHITLARLEKTSPDLLQSWLQMSTLVQNLEFEVSEISLMQSLFKGSGVCYESLATVCLGS